MNRWSEFAATEPEMADFGRRLVYQFGLGLGYIATVRKDGGPRLHPMCPLFYDDNLYAFIERSPKLHDLLRDGRYALHSMSAPNDDHEFYVTGRAEAVPADDPRQHGAWSLFRKERGDSVSEGEVSTRDTLFELLVDNVLMVDSPGHGHHSKKNRIWRAG